MCVSEEPRRPATANNWSGPRNVLEVSGAQLLEDDGIAQESEPAEDRVTEAILPDDVRDTPCESRSCRDLPVEAILDVSIDSQVEIESQLSSHSSASLLSTWVQPNLRGLSSAFFGHLRRPLDWYGWGDADRHMGPPAAMQSDVPYQYEESDKQSDVLSAYEKGPMPIDAMHFMLVMCCGGKESFWWGDLACETRKLIADKLGVLPKVRVRVIKAGNVDTEADTTWADIRKLYGPGKIIKTWSQRLSLPEGAPLVSDSADGDAADGDIDQCQFNDFDMLEEFHH